MASSRLKEEFLTCPICRDLFNDPRILDCLHSFCRECIVTYARTKNLMNTVECPTCRQASQVPAESLKRNFYISSLMESVTGTTQEIQSQPEVLHGSPSTPSIPEADGSTEVQADSDTSSSDDPWERGLLSQCKRMNRRHWWSRGSRKGDDGPSQEEPCNCWRCGMTPEERNAFDEQRQAYREQRRQGWKGMSRRERRKKKEELREQNMPPTLGPPPHGPPPHGPPPHGPPPDGPPPPDSPPHGSRRHGFIHRRLHRK